MVDQKLNREWVRYVVCVSGAVIYAAGVNLFVVSSGLYCGGLLGYCQIFRTLIVNRFAPNSAFDFSSLLYYLINVPILIIGLREVDIKFLLRTLVTISAMAAAFTVMPVIALLPEDALTGSIIGGIISGFANGMILRASSTAGGFDVISMILVKKKSNISVGRLTVWLSVLFFVICCFLFPAEIVVYSAIYLAAYSVTMDMIHTQNIEVEVKIVTHDAEKMEKEILVQLQRGVTKWNSIGAYTNQSSQVLCVIISKYELAQLNAIVKRHDPNAFMIVNSNVHIIGNFVKRI